MRPLNGLPYQINENCSKVAQKTFECSTERYQAISKYCIITMKLENPEVFERQIVSFKVILFGDWAPGNVVTLSQNETIIKEISIKNYLEF